MPDFRTMYESEFLYHFDLQERDVVVTIARCTPGEITGRGGKKSKKPLLYFQGKEKALALCKTNGRTIAALYGNKTEAWAGKRITLYSTTTTFGADTVGCIRIRPAVPSGKGKQAEGTVPESPTHDASTGEVSPTPQEPTESGGQG